jgi:hypothetical protein
VALRRVTSFAGIRSGLRGSQRWCSSAFPRRSCPRQSREPDRTHWIKDSSFLWVFTPTRFEKNERNGKISAVDRNSLILLGHSQAIPLRFK